MKLKKRFLLKKSLCVLLAVFLLGAVGGLTYFGRNAIQIESKTTELNLQDIGELVTQEAYITKVEAITKDMKFINMSVPLTNAVCVFSVDFQVSAMYDFEKIETKITKPKGKNKGKIELVLPEIMVNTSAKLSSEKVYYDKEGIFGNISEKEKAEARTRMEKEAENEALEKGLKEKAYENAKSLLTNFIYNIYSMEDYEIVFK